MHFIAYNIAVNKQRKEEYLYCVFKRADVFGENLCTMYKEYGLGASLSICR